MLEAVDNLFFSASLLLREHFLINFVIIFLSEGLIILVVVFSLVYVFRLSGWHNVVKLAFSLIVAVALSFLVGIVVNRPRPDFDSQLFRNLVFRLDPYSFPSKHATAAAAVAYQVYSLNKKVGYVLIMAAFLVGLGRILIGVHFLTDVVFGLLIGFLISLLISRLTKPNLIRPIDKD